MKKANLLLIILVTVLPNRLFAQLPGDLDVTFSEDGQLTTNIGISAREVQEVAIQTDGKIIVGGRSDVPGGSAFALARYNQDGSFDNSFSIDGRLTTNFDYFFKDDEAFSVAIQPDGKIIAAGSSAYFNSDREFALARYNADGTLDSNFNEDGKVRTHIGSGYMPDDIAYSVAIQQDGKIVVAGISDNDVYYSSYHDFALARYNIDGTLDSSFSSDGMQTTYIGPYDDYALSVAMQQDGKIVVGGHSIHNGISMFTLARYDTDGTLDLSFDTDGIVFTDVGAGYSSRSFELTIQQDGKIVAVGSAANSSNEDFALVRYNSDGTLDNSFSTDGIVKTNIGLYSGAASVVIQQDEKIVAAGFANNGSNYEFALARYNSDGTLDDNFNTDGILTNGIGLYGNVISIAVQTDGKIVAAGYAQDTTLLSGWALARFETDGTLDSNFSTDGKVISNNISSLDDYGISAALQTDGKIVVAGYTMGAPYPADFALARFNTEGIIDSTFGTNGIVTTNITGYMGFDYATAMAIQQDGKIIAVGTTDKHDFVLVRYSPAGTLDSSFGADGIITIATGSSSGFNVALAVAIQPDHKIVVAGYSYNNTDYDFSLVRYNNNGSLDPGFGNSGIVTTPIGIGEDDIATSIVALPDGKILVAGCSSSSNFEDFALAKYNSNGTLDASFGIGGKLTTPIEFFNVANSIAIQSDGKIVLAGFCRDSLYNFALARYNANGDLDITFSNDGKVITDFDGGESDQAFSVAVQPDGKIIAAGFSNVNFALARYNANGTLDNSFSTDGKVTTSIGQISRANSMLIQPDGKIVTAGSSSNGSDFDFALARYITDLSLGIINFSENSVLIYPNPIEQNATLEYTLSSDETLTISLYDLNGRMVKNFFLNEERNVGEHKEQLSLGKNVSTGSYVLVLSNGKQNISVKVVKE